MRLYLIGLIIETLQLRQMIMTGKRKDLDMTQGSIIKLLIKFAAPMLLGNIFQQMYNTVDMLVVGNFVGKEALAAVGSTGPIINTFIGVFMGFSLGSGIVISQFYGAQDEEGVHDTVHTTILMCFFISAALTIIGFALVPFMLRVMDTPDDVLPEAITYLRIYFLGATGLVFYNMGSSILRSVGDSKRPLYFLIFSAIINTVLDLVFVLVFDMGVEGVALATIIAQFLSALLILIILSRTEGPYRLYWSHLKINREVLMKVVKIGLPSSIQQGITSFSNVFVQGYINSFGAETMAGYSAYGKLDALVLLPIQSIAMGSSTFVGQNAGARKVERIKQGIKVAFLLSLMLAVVLIIPLMVFAPRLITLFNNDAEVIKYGALFIRLISPFYPTICVNQILVASLRGVGDTKAPVYIMLGSFVVFRPIYLFVSSRIFVGNLLPIAFAYPSGWVVCSVLIYIYFRHSRWEERCLL